MAFILLVVLAIVGCSRLSRYARRLDRIGLCIFAEVALTVLITIATCGSLMVIVTRYQTELAAVDHETLSKFITAVDSKDDPELVASARLVLHDRINNVNDWIEVTKQWNSPYTMDLWLNDALVGLSPIE